MESRLSKGVMLAALALVCLSLTIGAQERPIVLKAARMIDVNAGRLVEDATVVIDGGRIVSAGRSAEARVPANASIVDLGSLTLLPGLIDAHVHLTLGGDPAANARGTLAAGFTTVQDLGAAAYANVRLRDAIRKAPDQGPRIVASGPWLGISGGICDFNGIGVRGADAFRKRVSEDVEHGVDLIKVCVTGWLADAVDAPSKYEISDPELSAAIDEAHRRGKRVAVHALSEAGIDAAVRFGADLVVHAGFPSRATVAIMKGRRIPQIPTLFSFSAAGPEHLRAVVAHMRGAVADGLPVVFGTDAGVIPHGQNAREFEQFASIGMDAPAALRAATVSAANAIGMSREVGALSPGYLADVIGVDGNPLDDLHVLRTVRFVMKEGTIIKTPSAGADRQPR